MRQFLARMFGGMWLVVIVGVFTLLWISWALDHPAAALIILGAIIFVGFSYLMGYLLFP